MPDAATAMNWLVNLAIVAAIIVGLGLLYLHIKHQSVAQGIAAAQANPGVQVIESETGKAFSWIKAELGVLHDKLSAQTVKAAMPAVGAVFVDAWDVAEAFGASGAKNAVIIDDKPQRSGIDPAIVFKTQDGKLVRSA